MTRSAAARTATGDTVQQPSQALTIPPAEAAVVGVGLLGATGYGGAELIRLLEGHPHAALRAASSRQHAGRTVSSQLPALAGGDLVLDDDPQDPAAWIDRGVGVVFSALPHGAFAARAGAFLDAGLKVIDLSGDFRLKEASEYQKRYHAVHPDPELLGGAVYGLTEWRGAELEGAKLVANPGCYATAILLAALPAVEAGLWSGEPMIVNALSGVSGAGRAPSLATHFVECGSGASAYRVGEEHAHLGEIRQEIGDRIGAGAGRSRGAQSIGPVIFNPHLVPMSRGILASVALPMVCPMETDAVRSLYAGRYASSAFVRILEEDTLPETRHVRGSNRCDIAVRVAAGGRMLLVFSAIDNLVKGAAGQAIQNWNRMQGWPESTGLPIDGFGS